MRRQHSAKSGGEAELLASVETFVVTGFNLSESSHARRVQTFRVATPPAKRSSTHLSG
jgi:hypothetical protein